VADRDRRILIAPMPGAVPLKPGSGTLPMPGILAGGGGFRRQSGGRGSGRLPDHEAAVAEHDPQYLGRSGAVRTAVFGRIPGIYFTGDAARRDADGYFWILGRVDDVMNVSGHRLSTMEVESALVRHPAVAEAAVVGKPHEITGQAVCCFVTLKEGQLGPRRAGQGVAAVGGARDRFVRAAGGDPVSPMRCRRRAAARSCGGCCGRL
jgi:acetyl-CoA synthetase